MDANGIPGWEDTHSMDQTTDVHSKPVSSTVGTQAPYVWILGLAVMAGGIIVWQLRQPWTKDARWPWLALLTVMAVGASVIRQLDLWLPGQPIFPRLAQFPTRTVAFIGTF